MPKYIYVPIGRMVLKIRLVPFLLTFVVSLR